MPFCLCTRYGLAYGNLFSGHCKTCAVVLCDSCTVTRVLYKDGPCVPKYRYYCALCEDGVARRVQVHATEARVTVRQGQNCEAIREHKFRRAKSARSAK